MRITSTQNPAVRYVRSLDRASVRRKEGVYLVEGVRLVREALMTGQRASLVLYDPALLNRTDAGSSLLQSLPGWAHASHEVSSHVLEAAAQTETPAGVVAVIERPAQGSGAVDTSGRLGLILDRLSDPGNAGTILRTADALGVSYVVTLPDSVDLFAPKVVRAGMGAHFRLPVLEHVSWADIVAMLWGVAVIATAAGAGEPLPLFRWPERTALVIGSEAHGLSPEVAKDVATRVHIPMRPGVESLNAAVAACITMYAALGTSLLSRISVTDERVRRTSK